MNAAGGNNLEQVICIWGYFLIIIGYYVILVRTIDGKNLFII
jgi:hypothetical protein